MHQCITGEIKEICNKMNQSDEEQMPSVNPPPPGIVRFVDVQIYDVPAEDFPEDSFSVESTLKSGEENTAKPPVQAGNQGEPPQKTKETTENAPVTRVRLYPLPLALGILCVLFAGAVSVIYTLPLLA